MYRQDEGKNSVNWGEEVLNKMWRLGVDINKELRIGSLHINCSLQLTDLEIWISEFI
jgi:hypothetical protein